MLATSLDQEIAAFEQLLPSIQREHGSAWALVADRRLVRIFGNFSAAARYAREQYGAREVLIRHTDERALETAPFVHVPNTEG